MFISLHRLKVARFGFQFEEFDETLSGNSLQLLSQVQHQFDEERGWRWMSLCDTSIQHHLASYNMVSVNQIYYIKIPARNALYVKGLYLQYLWSEHESKLLRKLREERVNNNDRVVAADRAFTEG